MNFCGFGGTGQRWLVQLKPDPLGGGNVESGGQLKTLDLGEQGLAHVRHRLVNGKSLSRSVLEVLDLTAGAVTTDVPAELSRDAIQNLDWGGVGATDPSRSRRIQMICEHLGSEPGAVAIFEDQLAKSTDPVLRECPTKMLTVDDEVYHLLDFRDANSHAVEMTLSWQASAWHEVAFLSSVDSPIASAFPSAIGTAHLTAVAQGVVAVLVDAFDGESFAVWRASARRRPTRACS